MPRRVVIIFSLNTLFEPIFLFVRILFALFFSLVRILFFSLVRILFVLFFSLFAFLGSFIFVHFLSLGSRGVPFGGIPFEEERFIHWNFVNSDKEVIEKAKKDWKDQNLVAFPKVPGDEEEYVPLPEPRRL